MTAMPPLRDILNNTPANAIDVDFDFNTIEAHIANELINRDGSVAMTGPLTLSGPPTAPAHAVSKQYVDTSAIPVATIWEFAGASAPPGWALCDGASKSTTDPAYAALFAAIGYAYGGSGGNFNLPDRRGRVGVGRSSGDALFGALGQAGGSRALILPAHGHTANVNLNTTDTDTNHSHRYDHGHSAWSDAAGAHAHALQYPGGLTALWGRFSSSAAANMGGDYSINPGTAAWPYSGFTTPGISNDGSHAHGVGVNATGAINTGYSNNENPANHHHNINGGVTVNNAGADASNGNIPPYVTVNYIIRIG